MTVAWRTFKFFREGEARKVEFPQATVCCAAGDECLFFGCDGGAVHLLDRSLRDKLTFPAYGNRVLQVYCSTQHQWLLTVGTEEPGVSSTTLKVWNMERLYSGAATGSSPQPIRSHRAFGPKLPESEVTALAVHEQDDGHVLLALGLASGMVYWASWDLLRDNRVSLARLDARPSGNDLWCVRGVGFSGTGVGRHLFVVTESQTLVFNLQTSAKTVLDESGAVEGGVLVRSDGQLLVARPQALYFYTVEGRGACFAFNEQHHHLAWLGRNLVVVHETVLSTGASTSELKIFDLSNKLVVGNKSVSNVRHAVCAWGLVMVIQGDGTVVSLKEIPLPLKLEALFRRNCHTTALRLAEAEGAEGATLAHIYHQYGDHLYNDKRDYDAAMQQYLNTIGYLEPSYVIRKYLDAQRIQQLTLYLECLHERGEASADHTTLLLNCYTKLKDVEKLDAFVGIGGEAGGDRKKKSFDVETAVKVLRSAGYYSHALEIARSANEPNWYLDILLEDQGDYDEGVKFVFGLPRRQAAEAMKKYGKVLVTHRSKDSTGCLMKLCVPDQSKTSSDDGDPDFVASVSDFTHLYADKPLALVQLCEFVFPVYNYLSQVSQVPIAPPGECHLYHTLVELYLSDKLTGTDPPMAEDSRSGAGSGIGTSQTGVQEGGKARGQEEFGDGDTAEARRAKALALLHQGWAPGDKVPKYDAGHMLVLCRMHRFKEGLVFLYERRNLLREVIQLYIDFKDYGGIIEACQKHGDAARGGDPQLWSIALEYFSSHDDDCTEQGFAAVGVALVANLFHLCPSGIGVTHQIQEVLHHVEHHEILPPLVVLQTLARNPNLKLKVVKDYIAKQLQKDSKSIQDDRKEIGRLQQETVKMRERIHELKTEPQVCQRNVDEITKQPLELPAVHFLCGHSFNLRTLGEDASECPVCAPQYRETLRIRRDMKAGVAHQDKFFMELKDKKDGFGVVADWFGRGMLNVRSTHPH